jgi:hypothetical protein
VCKIHLAAFIGFVRFVQVEYRLSDGGWGIFPFVELRKLIGSKPLAAFENKAYKLKL